MGSEVLEPLKVDFSSGSTRADVGEAFFENIFELSDRSALEKHLPVTTFYIFTSVLQVTSCTFLNEVCASRAEFTLPRSGNFGVKREIKNGRVTLRASKFTTVARFVGNSALGLKAL